MRPPRYVLVTTARNEENYIRKTLDSVVNQTVPPKRWVIVSDGSTDRTDEIVAEYASVHGFISVFRIEENEERSFSCKAVAFNKGCLRLKGLEYEFIGNLDADVSFASTYYEQVLEEFEKDPFLGVAGGVILEEDRGKFRRVISSLDHTAGAIQFFRRECFEKIGGYPTMRTGGIDSVAEIMAEMNGWKSRAFPRLEVRHHRTMGTAPTGRLLSVRFREGIRDYHLGMHPFYAFARGLYVLRQRPVILGSGARLAGFLSAMLRREERQVSREFIRFVRKQQVRKLLRIGRHQIEGRHG